MDTEILKSWPSRDPFLGAIHQTRGSFKEIEEYAVKKGRINILPRHSLRSEQVVKNLTSRFENLCLVNEDAYGLVHITRSLTALMNLDELKAPDGILYEVIYFLPDHPPGVFVVRTVDRKDHEEYVLQLTRNVIWTLRGFTDECITAAHAVLNQTDIEDDSTFKTRIEHSENNTLEMCSKLSKFMDEAKCKNIITGFLASIAVTCRSLTKEQELWFMTCEEFETFVETVDKTYTSGTLDEIVKTQMMEREIKNRLMKTGVCVKPRRDRKQLLLEKEKLEKDRLRNCANGEQENMRAGNIAGSVLIMTGMVLIYFTFIASVGLMVVGGTLYVSTLIALMSTYFSQSIQDVVMFVKAFRVFNKIEREDTNEPENVLITKALIGSEKLTKTLERQRPVTGVSMESYVQEMSQKLQELEEDTIDTSRCMAKLKLFLSCLELPTAAILAMVILNTKIEETFEWTCKLVILGLCLFGFVVEIYNKVWNIRRMNKASNIVENYLCALKRLQNNVAEKKEASDFKSKMPVYNDTDQCRALLSMGLKLIFCAVYCLPMGAIGIQTIPSRIGITSTNLILHLIGYIPDLSSSVIEMFVSILLLTSFFTLYVLIAYLCLCQNVKGVISCNLTDFISSMVHAAKDEAK